jgi:hypothetical protein
MRQADTMIFPKNILRNTSRKCKSITDWLIRMRLSQWPSSLHRGTELTKITSSVKFHLFPNIWHPRGTPNSSFSTALLRCWSTFSNRHQFILIVIRQSWASIVSYTQLNFMHTLSRIRANRPRGRVLNIRETRPL